METKRPYYHDLGEYLQVLEDRGKLVRVKRQINKDTELMSLVRWQFRGLPEKEWKAFLFESVTDVKGRKYGIPVVVGTNAASREIYALAMNCKPDEIQQHWITAQDHPIAAQLIKNGPVQEVIQMGEELEKEGGGLEQFPVPISLPGFDPAPFITSGLWITKDPETGVPNIGTYRVHIKSRTRTGIQLGIGQHLAIHWTKAKSLGRPLEVAIALGGPPCLGLVSTAKIPYGMDELAVAGGIAGEPIKVVKCKTVDIEVPAFAEIVLEGIMPTDQVEPEGGFGEYTGYMGTRTTSPYFEIRCITRRKNPIYHAFIGQFPPNENSKILLLAQEATIYRFLKHQCNIPGILEVCLHEASGVNPIWVIRLKKLNPMQPWQALNCASGFAPNQGKFIIAVDEDIDARDTDSVFWAMGYRVQPHLDIRTTPGKALGLDPSSYAPETYSSGDFAIIPPRPDTSGLLIDATRKWDYPPVSLPKQEYMEHAKEIWEELGLPKLNPKWPWYGYSLGLWTGENQEEADLALKGDHFITGEKLAKGRKKV